SRSEGYAVTHEELGLRPKTGEFDLERVERYLAGLPFVARDPLHSELLIVAIDEEQLRMELEGRRQGERTYEVALIEIGKDLIVVANGGDDEVLRHARSIVQWLLDNFDCTITNEVGRDLTAVASGDAAKLYSERLGPSGSTR